MWRESWLADITTQHPEQGAVADICLIAEGCYPYVSGGVSNWIDWLIRSHPTFTFSVVAILPTRPTGPPRFERPSNLIETRELYLDSHTNVAKGRWPKVAPEEMADLLGRLLQDGNAIDFRQLITVLSSSGSRPSVEALLDSPQGWEAMCSFYKRMPHSSFLGYFWAWRTLVGGMLHMLNFPLPAARLYHAVSTGYAGLLAARATVETGQRSVITEHGIYSNERRIEILMADWISNSIDTGLDLSDRRTDIRDFWATSFDSFARVAYAVSSEITALYENNQLFQRALGADGDKLLVIPNGVDVERFSSRSKVAHKEPTIAFIGRVTPIKDVQTFLDVADLVRKQLPDLKALVIGPMDEDPDYAQACIAEATSRGLDSVVTFTGPADVREYLARIDVLVLTSISEALPLIILEAGAASVPCVTTDVGACRELLEGSITGDEEPPGGMVLPVGASEDMAAAIATLLTDQDLRGQLGSGLNARVNKHYRSEVIAEAYTQLYARHLSPVHAEEA